MTFRVPISMPKSFHVVFGTGPAGCWIARALSEMGLRVRAVNRSGKRPELLPESVEVVPANASDPKQAVEVSRGAEVIYQAMNPPYHRWEEEFPPLQRSVLNAAKVLGSRYVSIENLYMYDPSRPIYEDSPLRPRSRKGRVRLNLAQEVMDAHRRGDVMTVSVRSSDFYGPGVTRSAMGERLFGRLVKGKKAQLIGSADQPHSWAYIEDLGRVVAFLGRDVDAFGAVWIIPHSPPLTQREVVEIAGRVLGIEPEFSVISSLMMRLAGLFNPEARASVEMMYQFTEPFEVNSHRIEERYGLKPTPVDVGVERTIRWYLNRKQEA